MKDITSELLIKIGFIKNHVTPEESGQKDGYNYYSYEINDRCLLISEADDEVNNYFTISFFEFEELQTSNYVDLVDLIRVLKKMV